MAKRRKGVTIPVCITTCVLASAVAAVGCGFSYFREKYSSAHPLYSRLAYEALEEGSPEKKIASMFYEDVPVEEIHYADPVLIEDVTTRAMNIHEVMEDPDKNGDGITIEHVVGGTYEGYMMVVQDPSDVYIAINPGMASRAPGPELDWYVEHFNAAGGINGGGFEDYDGNGDGSIPAGIVIIDGQLVSGGAPQPIVGITKDHKLVCTTCSGEQALNMGVVEAVTFGPTLIEDGRVVYVPTTNLNMLNPRTAVGQKEDGTMLLLVIDGRGPSSFGAKYEDIIEIMQKYEAVNAGNLDGGNSSVMIYNGQYVHYPVSMYNSRNLPSVILVKGDE